ncbi:MAG TPA: TetR/AcrR family transcriptional regulator [Desulfotomaculum sp.]|nr:TetR/AcrR family transcriptional regulator [Desulfotomaculum sp.]
METDYKKRITGACKELAAVRGFSRVTVDELAAHMGMSKRTIYRHFKNKEDIVHSVITDFLSIMEQKVRQALSSSDDPVEKIAGVIRVVTENVKLFQPLALYDLQKYYPHLWDKVEQFRAEKIQQNFESLLLNNEKGYFRKVNPKIFTTALMVGIRSVINPVFIMENNLSLEESINSLFNIYLYGVVEDTGRH